MATLITTAITNAW